jgi:hypothetical protein
MVSYSSWIFNTFIKLSQGDTISINHNWLNAANLAPLYQCLHSDLEQVRHALRDCVDMDDFDAHCQIILRANSGWHYGQFTQMMCMAVDRFLSNDNNNNSSGQIKEDRWDDRVTWKPPTRLCEAEVCMQSFTIQQLYKYIGKLLEQENELEAAQIAMTSWNKDKSLIVQLKEAHHRLSLFVDGQ